MSRCLAVADNVPAEQRLVRLPKGLRRRRSCAISATTVRDLRDLSRFPA
jgi:hypothetical protein